MKKEIDSNFSFDLPKNKSNVMKVMGVGGGGSNAVNYMYKQGIRGVDFIVCNTDSQALQESPVPNKIQLGVNLTEGLGAGANPEIGKLAALESYEELKNLLETQTKMLFITAGMGGGTGTGAAPIIAEMAKEFNILTVGIVTIPFNFEGKNRELQAIKGLDKLKRSVDSIIIINNNKLREVYGNLGFKEGFSKADEVLATAAKGVAQVITHHYTQNIDLKDAKTVLSNSGTAIMGSSIASGSNRANEAVIKALDSPLLNDNKIEGSKNVLLLIVSGSDEITIDEIGEINEYIQNETGNNANIIMGVGEDLELGNNISVTVIATGFGDDKQSSLLNSEIKKVIYTLDSDHPFEKKLTEDEKKMNQKDFIKQTEDKILEEENNQKKIDSEINEILRNIDISYEIIDPKTEFININDIEVNEFEILEPEEDNLVKNTYQEAEISIGLFSNSNEIIDKEEINNNEKEERLQQDIEVGDEIEFIKIDLDEEITDELDPWDVDNLSEDNKTSSDEDSEDLFEKPIDMSNDDENYLRKENLKKYNYVFKSKNSTIEDLEKIPAYKRLGIEINESESKNDNNFSKTILNEDNELEFPKLNTYLNDNVD